MRSLKTHFQSSLQSTLLLYHYFVAVWTSWLHFYHCFILLNLKTKNTNWKQRSEEWTIFFFCPYVMHGISTKTRVKQELIKTKKLVFRGSFYQRQKLLFEICLLPSCFLSFEEFCAFGLKRQKHFLPLQCYADHFKVFITVFNQWTLLLTVVTGTISLVESSSN